MKTVGITGPPGAGKSTLFRAMSAGQGTGDLATVAVPDPRLDKLSELHASKKKVSAQIEIADVHETARTAQAATARLREMDALVIVIPAFGGLDAAKALHRIREDLILADMGPVDTRLGRARKDPAAKKEVPSLEAAMGELEAGRLLRDRQWEPGDLQVFSALAPITLRPWIVVFNVDESGAPRDLEEGFVVSAPLEAEVAGMSAEEATPLLEAYGFKEPALSRLILELYQKLDLITFFTTSDKESRAWEVKRGATAPEAAGVIHSDLQRGFIRAEVIDYDTLVTAGSWDKAKAQSLIRVEGKEYVFQEGDVTHFRFAV